MSEVEFLRVDWPAPAHVRAAMTTRIGGVSRGAYASMNLATHVGDDPAAVAENRELLQGALELPAAPRWLEQVHGTRVVDAAEACASPIPADASCTAQAGVVCAVMVADCLPILLTNLRGDVVAAVHAGWRGLLAGVVGNGVERLRQTVGDTSPWMAWLGPCIGPSRFEVGAEVRAEFVAKSADDAAAFALQSSGRYLADLPELARRELRRCGVERVYGGGWCTHSDSRRFYSFRRDGVTGRMAALIWRQL